MNVYKCSVAPGSDNLFALVPTNDPRRAAERFAAECGVVIDGVAVVVKPKPGESIHVSVVRIVGEVNTPWRPVGRPETYRVDNFDGQFIATLVGQCLRPVEAQKPLNRFPHLN